MWFSLFVACRLFTSAEVPGEVRLVVPRRDIPAGAMVPLDALAEVRLPVDYVPDTVLRDPGLIEGRTTVARLLKHEFIRAERLQPLPINAEGDPAWATVTPGTYVPLDDTVMTIVCGLHLSPGQVIREEDLYAVKIEPRFLPEGVFLSPEHVVGRTVCDAILPNEIVRSERLVDPDNDPPCRGPKRLD